MLKYIWERRHPASSVVVNAVLVEFRRSNVETDGHVLAGNIAGSFDSLDDNVESVFSSVEGWSETTFVTYCGRETAVVENFLEAVEHFSTHADTFLETACADGADHEFWKQMGASE